MRLRQAALAAADLRGAGDALRALLELDAPFRDPGVSKYGLENQVYALNDTFLEIVAPVEAETSVGRLLARRGGACGYMVILQVEDLAAARALVAAAGVRTVDALPPGGAAFTHLHPKDVGGAILSLDYMDPPERWDWAGPDWPRRRRLGLDLVGTIIGVPDPAAAAARWSEVLGRPARRRGEGLEIDLDHGRIRFESETAAGGAGLSGLVLRAAAPAAATLARAAAQGLPIADGAVRVAGVRLRFEGS